MEGVEGQGSGSKRFKKDNPSTFGHEHPHTKTLVQTRHNVPSLVSFRGLSLVFGVNAFSFNLRSLSFVQGPSRSLCPGPTLKRPHSRGLRMRSRTGRRTSV